LAASATPRALVIHGGFWKPQYDASLMEPVCGDLRARGWDAVNVEYRRGEGWPAMAEDILAAYHAAPADAAVGHSAGGQLAAWLAAQRPLRAVVSQAGVLDLERAAELRLSGGIVERVFGEHVAEASPINLRTDARVLCVHGTADDDVPVEISERFAAAHGAELALFEGEGHFGHIEPDHPMWRRAADWLDAVAR
jgi:dipeptidyl aminopeptidase/acylaminoacyl peptidase